LEELRALLPHWIEHNAEHAAEFRRWVELAGVAGPDIEAAATAMEVSNAELASALDKLAA
jgi:hypothetical protein